ncbi:pol polyprotein [Tanacetum coccineum]
MATKMFFYPTTLNHCTILEELHLSEGLSVEDLVVRLRIKEGNKLAQKNTYTSDSAKANMVEHAGSSSKFNQREKAKPKGRMTRKEKERLSHHAANCKMRSGAVDNGEKLYMGEGDVILNMTSEKEIKLTNVLYVLEIPKLTRTSFKSVKRTTEPLDMVRTDICDLKSLPTKGGNKYFITFIDDCTKYCYVNLLKSKDEAIDKFVLYKNEVENQLGKKIKVVRSDRGGEYVSPFAEVCAQHGIRHEFTAPYSPQQNGIAERKNRTLKEMVTAMLISYGMSQDMWGKAILTATYLLNKIPHKEKEETPYEL